MTTLPRPRRAPLAAFVLGAAGWLVGGGEGFAGAAEPAASDLAAAVEPPAEPVGAVLPSAPDRLELDGAPPPSIREIRRHLESGDAVRAEFVAERFAAATPPGRERDAANLALGTLYAEDGRHNLACEAFARVRAGDGPLAPLATHGEAEQESARGQPARAIDRCAAYRERWPDGRQAEDCLRIVALAHAELGDTEAALAAARAYDGQHPLGRIGEQVALRIATRRALTAPAEAIPLLQELAIDHTAPLTGRVSEEWLERLRSGGYPEAVVPTDPLSRQQRALSLRDSGRRDAAWDAFQELDTLTDPASRAFVAREGVRFAWQTQRWAFLVDHYRAELAETDDDSTSWNLYRALVRGGRFAEAGDLGLQRVGRGRGSWRRAEDEVGRTLMLARRYREARAQFDVVAARGGWSGRRAQLSAAFAAYMAGELPDAVSRLDAIIDDPHGEVLEARYWRSRAREKLGQPDAAADDRAWVLHEAPSSWYASLVRSREAVGPLARSGRWAGAAPLADLPRPPPPSTGAAAAPLAPPSPVPLVPTEGSPGFARWSPGPGRTTDRERAGSPSFSGSAPDLLGEIEPPPSFQPGELYQPDAANALLAEFAADHARRWPELRAISDLAAVGLYDLSGPLMSEWYEDWRRLVRRRDREARKLNNVPTETWRTLFFAARDHHHSARSTSGWWADQRDPERAREAYRLAYPLAHDRYVWRYARQRDIDPFLVLGLMRQESTYDATARSRVGARGAMQIMPRTGHLLADLAHDTSFDAGDLEDPTVAVGYAMRYLQLLMERFGGVYPLAVASYNAGPFNVSNWLDGVGRELPVDEFVEHIPYRETRDYVKKVTDGYAAYVDLYGPPGAQLAVPLTIGVDRPEVVDF
jgi:soluble lytic murein transglycosylase-like protein